MAGPYPSKQNRYFKLPPSYWIDYNGVKLVLEGWKVLRLKKVRDESIGTQYGISRTHGAVEPIYTLTKPNTKFQGQEEPKIIIQFDQELKVKSEEHLYTTQPENYFPLTIPTPSSIRFNR